jgi:hypothetical protein
VICGIPDVDLALFQDVSCVDLGVARGRHALPAHTRGNKCAKQSARYMSSRSPTVTRKKVYGESPTIHIIDTWNFPQTFIAGSEISIMNILCENSKKKNCGFHVRILYIEPYSKSKTRFFVMSCHIPSCHFKNTNSLSPMPFA